MSWLDHGINHDYALETIDEIQQEYGKILSFRTVEDYWPLVECTDLD